VRGCLQTWVHSILPSSNKFCQMQHSSSSYLSQDDSCQSECTPRDQDSYRKNRAVINSPENRKKRGRFFAIFGKSNLENIENEPSHFEMSQEDSSQYSSSQFSQDFTDRLGGLSMKASQDPCSHSYDSRSITSADGNSFPFGSNSNSSISNRVCKFNPPSTMKVPPLSQIRSTSNREIPFISTSSSRRMSSESQPNGVNSKSLLPEDNRKQITIAPAIENPFIKEDIFLKDSKTTNRRKSM
jgi:hypothetical protein